MAILKVAQMGHPILRRRADPVTAAALRSRDTQRLIRDMIETMREYDGVGLAAPQVHASIRLVVIASHRNPRYPQAPAIPLTVLVNPAVTTLPGPRIAWWEGCLSLPGLRGRVVRPSRVRVRALDRLGRPFTRVFEGFSAIVIQHETDHLDGVLYIDRMTDLKQLSFEREYQVHWAPAEASGKGA
ncbi:MAG: peptide deformylase [Candidatus Coatesbacteria bacterium]